MVDLIFPLFSVKELNFVIEVTRSNLGQPAYISCFVKLVHKPIERFVLRVNLRRKRIDRIDEPLLLQMYVKLERRAYFLRNVPRSQIPALVIRLGGVGV